MEYKGHRLESLEEIAAYIVNLRIKKTVVGGYDRADVYTRMQDIHERYEEYLEWALGKKERQLSEQRSRNKILKEALEEARKREGKYQAQAELAAEKYRAERKRSGELESKRQQAEDRLLSSLAKTEEKAGGAEPAVGLPGPEREEEAGEKIAAILEEAHREERRIIERARLAAERESIQVRSEYRYEEERHERWKAQAEEEKRQLLEVIDRVKADLRQKEKEVEALKRTIKEKGGKEPREGRQWGSKENPIASCCPWKKAEVEE